MRPETIFRTLASSALPLLLSVSVSASFLVDDFTSGEWNSQSSPYWTFDNGFVSRYYFQDGSMLGGTREEVLPDAAGSVFLGTISGGRADFQFAGYIHPNVEMNYGFSEGNASFPWVFDNLNLDVLESGNDVIRFHFLYTAANLTMQVSFNTPVGGYHGTGFQPVPESATPFIYDVPLGTWSEAELRHVNQWHNHVGTDNQYASWGLTRIEVLDLDAVPEPASLAIVGIGVALLALPRHGRRKRRIVAMQGASEPLRSEGRSGFTLGRR